MPTNSKNSVAEWLVNVENEDPLPGGQRLRKRKAAESAHPFPQKRVTRRTAMPASRGRGKGQVQERVPLNDTTPNNARRLSRRSSRHGSGLESSHDEALSRPFTDAPDLSHTSSRQSTAASTRSRSSSPRKLTTLAALPDPIVHVKQDPYSSEPRPPAHVQQMWDYVKDYARGRGILPREMKEAVQEADSRGEFGDESFDTSGKRKELGDTPPLERIEEIRLDTTRCKNRKTAPEEVWNDMSHVPIGQLACRYSKHASQVRWQNVKTADIAPRAALLPVTIAARPPDAARVDYAIVLEPSPKLQAALPLLETLPGTDDPSWAPTLMADVIHCPFVSVIETKKGGGDPQKAEYQIGIWAYAMFQRLRLLLEANGQPDEPLPCLPLFVAEGDKWELYIASQGPDRRTVIWNFDEIGKAVYRKGIYQIIAVHQAVCHLAHTKFRRWFEQHCVPQMDS